MLIIDYPIVLNIIQLIDDNYHSTINDNDTMLLHLSIVLLIA